MNLVVILGESTVPIKIMIVDDESSIPLMIKDYLDDETDFEVTIAISGEDALKSYTLETPDLCIVDMRLGGMTGNDFIIAASKINSGCKFIIHTGSIDYVLPQELIKMDITTDSILFKPVFQLDDFYKKIKFILNL